jgi:O-antigen/teichoic acid export membrane protein
MEAERSWLKHQQGKLTSIIIDESLQSHGEPPLFSTRLRLILNKYDDGHGVTAATATALLARVASSATVVIAMPVALHSLGENRFGAFLLLFGVVSWMMLGNFGVQSALGRTIASGDLPPDETANLVGSALAYAALTAGLTAVIVSIGFFIWMRTVGARINLPRHELFVAGEIMIAISFLQTTLQSFEGVQIGTLKIYVTNLTRILGSAFTLACLMILPRFWPSISVFVIATSGGLLVGSVLNAALVLKQVGISFSHFRHNVSRLRHLAASGFAFLVIGIASLIQTHVPVLIVASMRGAAAAVDFGLFIRLLFVLMSGLSMVTVPLWPAIMSARANADHEWIRKSVRVSGVLVVGAGVASLLVLAPFGAKVLLLWTGRKMIEPAIFQVLFGIYFLQMAWSHYWGIILIGLGRERLVAGVHIVEGLLILTLGVVLTRARGSYRDDYRRGVRPRGREQLAAAGLDIPIV